MPPINSLDEINPMALKALATLGQRRYSNPGAVGDAEHMGDQQMPYDEGTGHYQSISPLSPDESDRINEGYADQQLQHRAAVEQLQAVVRGRQQSFNPGFQDEQVRQRATTQNDLANSFAPDENARARDAAMSSAQTASDTYFLPGQTAMRNNANSAALERVRVPAELRMQGDIAGHELDLEGKMAQAAGQAGAIDQKNNSAFMDMYGKSMGNNMNPTDEQKAMLEGIMRQLMQKMHYQVPAAGVPAGR